MCLNFADRTAHTTRWAPMREELRPQKFIKSAAFPNFQHKCVERQFLPVVREHNWAKWPSGSIVEVSNH